MEPTIVIRLGEPPDAVEIGWDGTKWAPLSGDPGVGATMCRAAELQATREESGDNHLPPGVAVAIRTAAFLGARVVKAPSYPPLPEGTVS